MKDKVEVDTVMIAYEEIIPANAMSTMPIVFLHDSLGSITVWKDFPKTVSESTKHRVIVYDRQGYGNSDPFSIQMRDNGYLEKEADFLIKFLDALKIEKCILFGHSDGGSISLIAGGKYCNRVHAIITEGAHVFVEDITLEGIRKAKESYKTTDLRAKLEKHHGEKVKALFDAWTETWLTLEFKQWNIEDFLALINCPVLTIYGENDEYGTLRQLESIDSRVQGYSARLVIKGTGHTPHREAKEETLIATADFISALPAS